MTTRLWGSTPCYCSAALAPVSNYCAVDCRALDARCPWSKQRKCVLLQDRSHCSPCHEPPAADRCSWLLDGAEWHSLAHPAPPDSIRCSVWGLKQGVVSTKSQRRISPPSWTLRTLDADIQSQSETTHYRLQTAPDRSFLV